MNLTAAIRQRLEDHRILLMGHLIVGYPSLDINWRMLENMAQADVDLVELQMPFSEPIADGPAFARASQQALQSGVTLDQYFDLFGRSASTFRMVHLMMGYYNVVLQCGHESFCTRLAEAGGAGCIIPDLPLEEYGELLEAGAEHGLNAIQLMAPTNTPQRLAAIGKRARGFVYAVARKGVTGRKSELSGEVFDFLADCRRYTDLPLGVGFGLQSGEHLHQLHGHAEIGIVGSALLGAWESGGEEKYRRLLASLTAGRD